MSPKNQTVLSLLEQQLRTVTGHMYFFSSPLKSGSSKAPETLQQKQPKVQALSTARANTTLQTQLYNKRLNSS